VQSLNWQLSEHPDEICSFPLPLRDALLNIFLFFCCRAHNFTNRICKVANCDRRCLSQWPPDVRHGMSWPAPTLEPRVRIPLETFISVCVSPMFELSSVGRALRRADLPSRESYQLSTRAIIAGQLARDKNHCLVDVSDLLDVVHRHANCAKVD
jgi:hypothetical protein